MSDEEFVMSCYPEAHLELHESYSRKGYIILESVKGNLVLDHIFQVYTSPEKAWSEAVSYIKDKMLEKLEE